MLRWKNLILAVADTLLKKKNLDAFLLLAIRNLAIAQAHNLPVLTLCKCCFGSLKQAEYHFKNDPDKQAMINWILQKEGLYYDGGRQSPSHADPPGPGDR